MDNTLIIAFTGEDRVGKSFCAEQIKGKALHFATDIKAIAIKHFGWDGKKDKKGRRLLRVLGTEAGRDYNPDIWVEKMAFSMAKTLILGDKSITIKIDDLRFDNEARLIKEFNGIIIKVIKRKSMLKTVFSWFGKFAKHHSERGINKKYIDYTITAKEGDLDSLNYQITNIMRSIYAKN
jgi:hypothetical protein